jgi:hypothetical protein
LAKKRTYQKEVEEVARAAVSRGRKEKRKFAWKL